MLGIEISRNRAGRKLWVTQLEYTDHGLKRFGMEAARSADTPMQKLFPSTQTDDLCIASGKIPFREAIGSLIYLVSCTRPDIAPAVHRLSQHLESPTTYHWTAVKRVSRYLSTTTSYGIQYMVQLILEQLLLGSQIRITPAILKLENQPPRMSFSFVVVQSAGSQRGSQLL